MLFQNFPLPWWRNYIKTSDFRGFPSTISKFSSTMVKKQHPNKWFYSISERDIWVLAKWKFHPNRGLPNLFGQWNNFFGQFSFLKIFGTNFLDKMLRTKCNGQNVTDKMLRTRCLTDKMSHGKIIGQNSTGKSVGRTICE